MPDFDAALSTFVTGCKTIADGHRAKIAPNVAPDEFSVDDGQNYIRVVRGDGTGRSVHCFVAKRDVTTKGLGAIKCGDVLKAAGWKAPARGVRGNIFDARNGLGRMGPYGPEYNR